jgi:hypothetical protein
MHSIRTNDSDALDILFRKGLTMPILGRIAQTTTGSGNPIPH